MGREFKKNNLSLVLFNRLKILHIIPVGLISKKENKYLACAAHLFLHFFDIVSHNYNVEIPSYTSYMYVGNVLCSPKVLLLVFLFAFFSLPLIFTLVAASISLFVTANFHVFLPTKFVSFLGFIDN